MKINPSAYNIGKAGVTRPVDLDTAPKSGAAAAALKTNTDKISISNKGAFVDQLTKSIVSQMEQPASQERLDSLKSAVQDGTYHIPTEDLVDAVVGRWMGL